LNSKLTLQGLKDTALQHTDMHRNGMQVIINAQSLAVISYEGTEGKWHSTHVTLTVVSTPIDGD